ncbi:TetR/AcrR family transcriptional regulator [Marinactinospora rubrisoli]|uniref:TetR/AcrR family transcriptional regulator n=1 Tax=Marinactinospora rubrisoli TaxID=2715399 RepID=A0ABW2KC01_9ACTN
MARTADPDRTAQRREAILLAAGRLFGERGYERTTVAHIAEAAGLSAASVFYYFADKPAVFRAVFERDLPLAEALIDRHADAADPVAAILDVLSDQARDAADPGAAGMVVELLRRVEHDPDLLSVVTRTARVVRDGLAGLIARGIEDGAVDPDLDPAEAASWLQAIVDATYLNARPGHSPVAALRRTALAYLAPNQPGGTHHHE